MSKAEKHSGGEWDHDTDLPRGGWGSYTDFYGLLNFKNPRACLLGMYDYAHLCKVR